MAISLNPQPHSCAFEAMIAYAQPMSCVTREIVLPVPRERAWELITEPSELEEWLADDVEFEAEEGAPVRADDREGVVEVVDDEERIVFTWGESRVEWRLADAVGGPHLPVPQHPLTARHPDLGP